MVHLEGRRRQSMKSKSHRYFLPSPWGTQTWQTSHCDNDWWVVVSHGSWVMGHGSRVTRVTGQLTDGSPGSRVIKCDPLSALLAHSVEHSRSLYYCAKFQTIPIRSFYSYRASKVHIHTPRHPDIYTHTHTVMTKWSQYRRRRTM